MSVDYSISVDSAGSVFGDRAVLKVCRLPG